MELSPSLVGKSRQINYKWAIFKSYIKLPEGTLDTGQEIGISLGYIWVERNFMGFSGMEEK